MSLLAVTTDSREPAWVQALEFGCKARTIAMLEYGDLLCVTDDSALLAVERKTAGDLLASVADGRLWHQSAGMRKVTPWCYLVVTGTLACSQDGHVTTERGVTGWAWSSLQGALLQAQELGAMVTFAQDDADYEPTVIRLSQRSHEATVRLSPVKESSVLTDSERILAAMPGVGLERAAAIIDYCGTCGWALTMLTTPDHGEHIAGIGPGTKAKIRTALGLRDNEYLSVIDTEGRPKERE